MATIKPVQKWQYNGKLFDTAGKAIAANEEEINNLVGKLIMDVRSKHPRTGLTAYDNIGITEFLLEHRKEIVRLFDLEVENDDGL